MATAQAMPCGKQGIRRSLFHGPVICHVIQAATKGKAMTKDQICELYDSNPDMTLAQLSRISGKSVAQLKQILMAEG